MQLHQLFSRRNATRKVDFRPDDLAVNSPAAQLRRLRRYLSDDHDFDGEDLKECDDAINALREYSYRKIFTAISHAEYLDIEKNDPGHIDWMVAAHEMETDRFRGSKRDQIARG